MSVFKYSKEKLLSKDKYYNLMTVKILMIQSNRKILSAGIDLK